MFVALVIALALYADQRLGEPKRYHPLVGFGTLASYLEQRLNRSNASPRQQRLYGTLAWAVLTLPLPAMLMVSQWQFSDSTPWLMALIDAVVLYAAIGLTSLKQHAERVYRPLAIQDLALARHYCSHLVSRDTADLSATEIRRAVIESVLENGHDSALASVFWYLVGGAPLVVLHRLSNTLDAMWGYRTPRYCHFGFCSAKIDDLLGWPSAKITSVLYALQGNLFGSLYCAWSQARHYKSLNGGWVMASGACALGITLGGSARYAGKSTTAVLLGKGRRPVDNDIPRAIILVQRACWLLLVMVTLLSLF